MFYCLYIFPILAKIQKNINGKYKMYRIYNFCIDDLRLTERILFYQQTLKINY